MYENYKMKNKNEDLLEENVFDKKSYLLEINDLRTYYLLIYDQAVWCKKHNIYKKVIIILENYVSSVKVREYGFLESRMRLCIFISFYLVQYNVPPWLKSMKAGIKFFHFGHLFSGFISCNSRNIIDKYTNKTDTYKRFVYLSIYTIFI